MSNSKSGENPKQNLKIGEELDKLFTDLNAQKATLQPDAFSEERDPKATIYSFEGSEDDLLALGADLGLTDSTIQNTQAHPAVEHEESRQGDPSSPIAGEPFSDSDLKQFFELDNLPPLKSKAFTSSTTIAYYLPLDKLAENLAEKSQPIIEPVDWDGLTQMILTSAHPDKEQIPKPDISIATETRGFAEDNAVSQEHGSQGKLPNESQSQAEYLARPKRKKAFEPTLRVPVKQLDDLSNLMGELIINRNSLEDSQARLRRFLSNLTSQVQRLSDIGGRMQNLYERSLLEQSLLDSRNQYQDPEAPQSITRADVSGLDRKSNYDPLEMDHFTDFHLLSQEMIELIVQVRESASDVNYLVDDNEQISHNLRQVSSKLQEGLTKSRMVPFARAADRLVRPVREISLKLGKQASLQIKGREVLIDKVLLEQLYDPLIHLINNAIAHGIERPGDRQAIGKSATGNITLEAYTQGNQIVISLADDGAGIDPGSITKIALKNQLITPEQMPDLTPESIYDLIFQPGFTTKVEADNFSGRGVGLDVVRTTLSGIRGAINIESELGKGTTFTIRLPLTFNICRVLSCVNGNGRIAIPMDGVEDMKKYRPDQVEQVAGKSVITWQGSRLELHPLSKLMVYQRQLGAKSSYSYKTASSNEVFVVILKSSANTLAIQVDAMQGEQEVVIKQIEGPLPTPVGIAGVTILGDGTIMPIADVLELIQLGSTQALTPPVSSAPPVSTSLQSDRPTVLIVDDSITVRQLLSMTFKKAGYRTEAAKDGQEALMKLMGGVTCALVLCDIEMPRMDGLELLRRLGKNNISQRIPIAMLTSRGAERHRKIAAELGAKAYLTKPYIEEQIVQTAQRLIAGETLLDENGQMVI